MLNLESKAFFCNYLVSRKVKNEGATVFFYFVHKRGPVLLFFRFTAHFLLFRFTAHLGIILWCTYSIGRYG
jgi:hypothetical protein